jgi:methylmalonyl-CoA mutase
MPAPGIVFAPLAPGRDAEPFERLRDRADARAEATGARQKIFLANLGPVSAFTARAAFAKNLFEAAGIEAVTNDGFADETALASAFATSDADTACLCSSDAIYAERGPAAAKALKAAGARRIHLAGRPGEAAADLRAAGIADFVFAGCDAAAVLDAAQA